MTVKITAFDVTDYACQIACEIPRGDGTNGTFNAEQWMDAKEIRRYDDFIIYAMAAAKQAMKDSGLNPDQIDKVLLVGGSTRIPAVQDAIRNFLSSTEKDMEASAQTRYTNKGQAAAEEE